MFPNVFADRLKQTMGLDVAAIGCSTIEHAVRRRMAARSLEDVGAYERCLHSSERELQALIEAAVVPETWFFRDAEAFAEMARAVEVFSLRVDPGMTIRLLSLPCSTGEEPYSMAMTLLQSGFSVSRFRIDAIDISEQVLVRAEAAVYGKNSFRGADLAFRERDFENTATGHRLRDCVREVVHFRQGNMLAPDFLPQVGLYDIIFCRNLLVYFDRPTQTRAIETLRRLLTDQGTVFVGPAEAGMMFDHGFVWSKVPLAFAFQKKCAVTTTAAGRPAPVRRRAHRAPGTSVAPPRMQSRAVPNRRAGQLPIPALAESRDDLAEATTLADSGRFTEATAICHEHLRRHGSSAAAFFLLGLICDAGDRTADALRYFRKALYLESEHSASLVHLALLLEKNGDAAGARLLRERLARQQSKDAGTAR